MPPRLAFAGFGGQNRAISSQHSGRTSVDGADPSGRGDGRDHMIGSNASSLTPDDRLVQHLRTHLGVWPPSSGLTIVGSAQRTKPGWGEAIRPILGIETVHGALLSVPPKYADQIRALGPDLDSVGPQLSGLLGKKGWRFGRGFFRWTTSPTPLVAGQEPGTWVDSSDLRLPEWLSRFSGEALVAIIDGNVAACVGIKRHNHWGHELAIKTEEPYRRKGLASRLVAQAASRVLDQGAIPLYVHADDNVGSAKAAQTAGFDDLGWRVVGLFPPPR